MHHAKYFYVHYALVYLWTAAVKLAECTQFSQFFVSCDVVNVLNKWKAFNVATELRCLLFEYNYQYLCLVTRIVMV